MLKTLHVISSLDARGKIHRSRLGLDSAYIRQENLAVQIKI